MTRCHATARAAKTSEMTTSYRPAGSSRRLTRASPTRIDTLGLIQGQPEDLAIDPDDRRIELQDPVCRSGPLSREMPRQREGATADMERGQGARRRADSLDDGVHRPQVAEPEGSRLVEVDRAVDQVVED